MGLFPRVKIGMEVAGLLLVLSFPSLVLAECTFGPSNMQDLVLRNKTILAEMNSTLFLYTTTAQKIIPGASGFNIEDFIFQKYNVSRSSYLEFVSMGKMLSINWTEATKTARTNGEYSGLTLDLNIKQDYIDPVHAALQDLASYYSISMGIFRPNRTQFHFTGFNSCSNNSLDICHADIGFVWKLYINLTYNETFDNKLGIEYATLATTIESTFDEHYRTKSIFNGSFVRTNFLSTEKSPDNNTIGYMEAYFRNKSYNENFMNSSLLNLTQIIMTYNDRVSSPKLLGLMDFTRINHTLNMPITMVTIQPPITFQLSGKNWTRCTTSTRSAVRNTQKTTNFTSEIYTTRSSKQISSSSNEPPSTTSPLPLPSVLATLDNTTNNDDITGNSSVVSLTPLSTMITFSNLSATLSGFQDNTSSFSQPTTSASTSATSINNNTSVSEQITSSSLTSTAFLGTIAYNTTTGILSVVSEFLGTTTISPPSSLTTASSGLLTMNGTTSRTATMTVDANITFQTNQTFPVTAANTISSFSNGSNFSGSTVNNGGTVSGANVGNNTKNGGTTYVPSTGINTSSKNTTRVADTGITINDGGTTFDSDPFFQAHVPVVPKVYNDYLLLKKMGTMAPVTEKGMFFSITIPVSIGIIAGVIICMLCWQVDCLVGRQKV